MSQEEKAVRVVSIFERLMEGAVVDKQQVAEEFAVSPKSIQRDINALKKYLLKNYEPEASITYCRSQGGYILERDQNTWLTKEEILGLARIVLESRAFNQSEMDQLLDKLIVRSSAEDKKKIKEIIANERYHYTPVNHQQPLLDKIWELSQALRENQIIELSYQKEYSKQAVRRRVEPLGIIFSEYYFYLITHLSKYNDDYKVVYRLDRIRDYQITEFSTRKPR